MLYLNWYFFQLLFSWWMKKKSLHFILNCLSYLTSVLINKLNKTFTQCFNFSSSENYHNISASSYIFSFFWATANYFVEISNNYITNKFINYFRISLSLLQCLVKPSSNQQLMTSSIIINILDLEVHFWRPDIHSDLCQFTVIWKRDPSFIYKINAKA